MHLAGMLDLTKDQDSKEGLAKYKPSTNSILFQMITQLPYGNILILNLKPDRLGAAQNRSVRLSFVFNMIPIINFRFDLCTHIKNMYKKIDVS
jgi:hypothetical protein